MKLILMTTPHFFVEEHPILTALFDEELDFLHIRKPNTEPVYSERLLSLIPEQYRKRIIVHDHYYLHNEYKLYGIHVTQRAELPEKYKGRVTCTCQTAEQVKALKSKCDYTIFAPNLNDNSIDGFDAQHLKQYKAEKLPDKKVMAFGNINEENIQNIANAGFGGAVLYGCIWNRFDTYNTQDFKELISYFRKLKKLAK